MKRELFSQLIHWKNSTRRKPLVLRGARQVGKTYLLKKLGQDQYENYVYFNFEEDPRIHEFFDDKLKPQNILQKLELDSETKILPHKTLIIFDEIQACEKALTSLKYFCEQAADYHVAAAGSLLGIKLSTQTSFPVGKVNFLHLHPLSFFEFLSALNKEPLRDYLFKNNFQSLPLPFHQDFIEFLRYYYFVGGMPEAVQAFAQYRDWNQVREIQKDIIDSYQLDFSKHASASDILKLAALWESIPGQLAKENKKFIFSNVHPGARSREYENALQWLIDAGLIHKSYQISAPKLPLKAYAKKNFFKLYLLDVGLLSCLVNLSEKILLEKNHLFQEFHGALTENFVAQELIAAKHQELYYWQSPGTAEVDFLLALETEVIPLEVKAGLNRQSRSLRVYESKYHPQRLVRCNLRNFKDNGNLFNLPLYAVSLAATLAEIFGEK